MKEAYLRSVGALLDCPVAERKRLLRRLEGAVTAYLEDTPDADETELIKNFGAPEACAAQLLEECDPAVVADIRRKKKRRNRILVAALAALLTLAVIVAAYLWFYGKLVVIETTHYADGFPEDIPMDQVVYYNDEDASE